MSENVELMQGIEFPEFVNKYGTVLELKNPTNNKTVVAVVAMPIRIIALEIIKNLAIFA